MGCNCRKGTKAPSRINFRKLKKQKEEEAAAAAAAASTPPEDPK